MKPFLLPITIFLLLSLIGCSDKESNYSLSSEYLMEGSWQGQYSFENYRFSLAIQFRTGDSGKFHKTSENEDEEYNFSYEIREAKTLNLKTMGTIELYGEWDVYDIKENYLLLYQGRYGNYEGKRLELRRTSR